MARDITLIGHFGQWQTLFFFQQLADVDKDFPGEQLVLRVNSQGGHPQEAQSIIEKAQEIIERVQAVKGNAQMHSTALFLYAYFPVEICECLDTTQGVLHRAAYDEDFEQWSGFKGSMWEQISIKLNNDMQRALRNRIDVEALEALPQMKANNITLKSIFDMTQRVSVVLTGSDMKKIGLVSKINKITPARATAMAAQIQMFEKCNSLKEYKLAAMATNKTEEEETPTTMTLAELKAKFPTVYAEAKAEGVTEEKDRVEAIMVFNDVDPAGVKAAIESGKPMSAKQTAEFARKSMNATALTAAAGESAANLETQANAEEEEEVATETAAEKVKAVAKVKPGLKAVQPVAGAKTAADQKKIDEFEKGLDALLGLNKKAS
jgi:ATP-dependent protease ClpP protease subunit